MSRRYRDWWWRWCDCDRKMKRRVVPIWRERESTIRKQLNSEPPLYVSFFIKIVFYLLFVNSRTHRYYCTNQERAREQTSRHVVDDKKATSICNHNNINSSCLLCACEMLVPIQILTITSVSYLLFNELTRCVSLLFSKWKQSETKWCWIDAGQYINLICSLTYSASSHSLLLSWCLFCDDKQIFVEIIILAWELVETD